DAAAAPRTSTPAGHAHPTRSPYRNIKHQTGNHRVISLQLQYDLNVCCLRAPWVMEKDDFRCQLSFGEDVFGGPRWRDLVGTQQADAYAASGTIPVMLDQEGRPVKRNFVHVGDLANAILCAIDNPAARQ